MGGGGRGGEGGEGGVGVGGGVCKTLLLIQPLGYSASSRYDPSQGWGRVEVAKRSKSAIMGGGAYRTYYDMSLLKGQTLLYPFKEGRRENNFPFLFVLTECIVCMPIPVAVNLSAV